VNIPRKSIEPMVLTLKGADRHAVRAMQQFLSEGAWEDDAILPRHWQEVDADLGDAEGVLTLEGSDFPTQGTESVGVKRQYCGELGQRANCQAGVVVGYVSPTGSTLRDRRWYLPQAGVTEGAYAERRQACGVPEGLSFTTKPRLGWTLLQAVMQAGTLRCRWVVCDAALGRETTRRDNMATLGWWYFAAGPHDTHAWQGRPATAVPNWSGRGRQPPRARLVEGDPAPVTVAEIAAAVPAEAWSRQSIQEGSQGPLFADFAMPRVIAGRPGLPGPESWLVRRRPPAGELKAYLCNAPADTAPTRLVRTSGRRWPMEPCFETGKQ
jgi:SRSO17 transposase